MSLIKYTTEIVKAYVTNNEIPPGDLVGLIEDVHQSLVELSGSVPKWEQSHPEEEESFMPVDGVVEPIISPDLAVRQDVIICLICGKENKAIRGHLTRTHGMDINSYRRMFSLPDDFPMVAPDYSAKRRQLAIDGGLGEKLRSGK